MESLYVQHYSRYITCVGPFNHHNIFPAGSDGKEPACNARDLGSIPGLGRSPGGRQVNHSSILPWRIPMDSGAWRATVHGVTRSQTWLSDFTFTFHFPALEKEMATHSSILAWRIPGTGEPGGLPSMGSHRVGHDWGDLAAAAAAAVRFQSLGFNHYGIFLLHHWKTGNVWKQHKESERTGFRSPLCHLLAPSQKSCSSSLNLSSSSMKHHNSLML